MLCAFVSVCLLAYLENHTAELYKIFYACCLCVGLSFNSVAISYVLPVWQTTSCFP